MSPKGRGPKPSTLCSAATAGIVIVEVGTEPKKYHVHKALLTSQSDFFKKALTGTWKEAQEGVVRLNDVEPKTFDLFVSWLYSGNLLDEYDDYDLDEEPYEDCLLILKAYILADRLLASRFRRAANKGFLQYDYDMFGLKDFYSLVTLAFEQIASHKPILQRLVDEHCRYLPYGWQNELEKELVDVELALPQAFTRRVMYRFGELQNRYQRAPSSRYPWSKMCYEECSNDESDDDAEECCTMFHMKWDETSALGTFPEAEKFGL